MKLKAGGTLVLAAGLGLSLIAGCAEEPGGKMGKVDVPADAPKSSEDAAKAMLKTQQGMYGGGKMTPPMPGAPAPKK